MEILIFENSKQITQRLMELISETVKNITFLKASSYSEALYFLRECNPEVMLLDLKYPGNSSVELLKKINQSNSKPVVIALLNETEEAIVTRCKEYGADFIFDKYSDFEKIPGVIKTLI